MPGKSVAPEPLIEQPPAYVVGVYPPTPGGPDACESCGSTNKVASLRRASLRTGTLGPPRVLICASCLAVVLEAVTGWAFRGVLERWEAVSRAAGELHRDAPQSERSKRKQREEQAAQRRRKAQQPYDNRTRAGAARRPVLPARQ